MKKIISILIVLGLILSGCGTGIEPNVPTKVTEETTSSAEVTANDTSSDESNASSEATTTESTGDASDTEEATSEEAQSGTTDEASTENETTEVSEGDTEEASEEATDAESGEESTEETEQELVEEVPEEETQEETQEEIQEETTEDEQASDTTELPVIDAPVIGGQETANNEMLPTVTMPIINATAVNTDEVRAVWLSYLDLQPMFASRTEAGYRQALSVALDNIASLGMNTVMYQVRPFGDALYKSSLFPSSYIVSGTEGTALGYDPLEIAIGMAHERELRIEAWINPYRVRTSTSKMALSQNNIAKVWYEDDSRRVLSTKEGAIIYNPALEEVQDYIVAGVKEIIDHYAVDGIHFDDYFYPTTDMSFDEIDYLSYQYDADPMAQDVYRRNNVNQLVKKVYQLVHSYNRDLVFGISPQGNIETNYNQLYVDIPMWLSAGGYVDYICPQVYFGFEHERTPYESVMDDWAKLIHVDVDLIAGLAVYKVGTTDKWAGTGSQEWVENTRMLQRMIETAKVDKHYGGYALFRYDSLFNPASELTERMSDELKGIEETINK